MRRQDFLKVLIQNLHILRTLLLPINCKDFKDHRLVVKDFVITEFLTNFVDEHETNTFIKDQSIYQNTISCSLFEAVIN